MALAIPSYDDFKTWCQRAGTKAALRAIEIAENRDQTNRTGHMLRGYLAAAPFLLSHPEIRRKIVEQGFTVKKPLNLDAVGFTKPWRLFLKQNKSRHEILRHILPRSLGGVITTGGGGAYPFKLAVRLAAQFLGDQPPTTDPVSPKYQMVRRREFDRDSDMVQRLKELYDFRCQVCGQRIEIRRNKYYCEGHHLRPLGGAHGGEDAPDNVVILCPTHHAEFDFFLIAILDKRKQARTLEHMNRTLGPGESTMTVRHPLNPSNVDYVIEQFLIRLDLHFPKVA